jgi:uncharacterized membrane protein YeaQ/YmgE (transglycosylase-associated protein family)
MARQSRDEDRRTARRFLNVVVGIVGAIVGGWLLSPMLGVGTINDSNFSLPALAFHSSAR